jgi:hypothetical protein
MESMELKNSYDLVVAILTSWYNAFFMFVVVV